MDVALLDSSAYVAFLDRDDALHPGAAAEVERLLRAGSPLAVCSVTWAEMLNGAYQGRHDEGTVRGFATDLNVEILPVDAAVAEQAARLQADYAATARKAERPRLRTPDALILATAVVQPRIDVVVCGDAQWPKVPGLGLEIRLLQER